MQLSWLVRGLRTGIVTTRYPRGPVELPEGIRGQPVLVPNRCRVGEGCDACARACVPGAIKLRQLSIDGGTVFTLDYGACIMCGLCVTACPNDAMTMTPNVELAVRKSEDLVFATYLPLEHTNGSADEPIDHA